MKSRTRAPRRPSVAQPFRLPIALRALLGVQIQVHDDPVRADVVDLSVELRRSDDRLHDQVPDRLIEGLLTRPRGWEPPNGRLRGVDVPDAVTALELPELPALRVPVHRRVTGKAR